MGRERRGDAAWRGLPPDHLVGGGGLHQGSLHAGAARGSCVHAGWWAGGRAGDVTRGAQLFGFRVQATLGGRSTLKEGHGKGMLHEEVEQESTADRNLHPTVRSGAGADQRLQPSWGEPPSGPGLKVAAALVASRSIYCCVYGRGVCPRGRVREPRVRGHTHDACIVVLGLYRD